MSITRKNNKETISYKMEDQTSTWSYWLTDKFSNFSNKPARWLFNYQDSMLNTIQNTGYIIGGSLASSAYFSDYSPLTKYTMSAWSATITYASSHVKKLGHFITDYITCKKIDPTQHFYKESQSTYNGHICGKLYYNKHLPILDLTTSDPYENGWAQGDLLAEQFTDLKEKYDYIIHTLKGDKSLDEHPKFVSTLKKIVPKDYQAEMLGFADGYNSWADKNNRNVKLTFEEMLELQLIADSRNLIPSELEHKLPLTACTTIMHNFEHSGLAMLRKMDWAGFGNGGGLSYLKKQQDGTASFNPPGVIGGVTSWSENGVCASVNVSPGKTDNILGIPTLLALRSALRDAKTVDDVIEKLNNECTPASAAHFTIADAKGNGAVVSTYQGNEDNQTHYIRKLEKTKPLFTVNCRYPDERYGFFNSSGRTCILSKHFKQMKEMKNETDEIQFIKDTMAHEAIDVKTSIHGLFFLPEKNKVYIANNNGFACSTGYYHELNMTDVFKEQKTDEIKSIPKAG